MLYLIALLLKSYIQLYIFEVNDVVSSGVLVDKKGNQWLYAHFQK